MLQKLIIENFAIIDQLEVSFDSTLNVFTGETGAGKSIILDALNLLCGGKFDSACVRNPKISVLVEAEFCFGPENNVTEKLMEQGIKITTDGLLDIRREITPGGKNICKCNGRQIKVNDLKNIAPFLVNIHSQHQTYQLLSPSTHFTFFLEFSKPDFQKMLTDYQKDYEQYRGLLQQRNFAEQRKAEIIAEKKRLEEDLEIISTVEPGIDEEKELDKRHRFTVGLAEISTHVQNIASILDPDDEYSINSALIKMRRELDGLQRLDKEAVKLLKLFDESSLMFDELKGEIGIYESRLEGANPEEIYEIEKRMANLEHLKRRFGLSIPEILEYEKQAAEKLFTLIREEQGFENMDDLIKQLGNQLATKAHKLTDAKKAVKKRLEQEINRTLEQLNMSGAEFEVHFYRKENFLSVGEEKLPVGNEGSEATEFYLRSNKGQDSLPLAKVASGGEVSRLMLALKKAFTGGHPAQTFIFDEIDTGIGGDTAHRLAEVLREISLSRQSVVITHLAQIALAADAHYLIEKKICEGRTESSIRFLNPEERNTEILRMLGMERNDPQANELIKEMFAHKTKNQTTKR
jgi:DNA repair protein RecN (Recombination protein N)